MTEITTTLQLMLANIGTNIVSDIVLLTVIYLSAIMIRKELRNVIKEMPRWINMYFKEARNLQVIENARGNRV